MEIISEALVEETWREVAELEIEQAQAEMAGMGRIQPNLVAFMVEFTKELKPDVAELALYLFFNVYRMFKKSRRKPLEQVTHQMVVERFESNDTLMNSLENTHDRFVERIARIQLLDQPFVLKYVLEALFEDEEEEEDDVELTEDDKGYLFLLLLTVVDAMDKTNEAP